MDSPLLILCAWAWDLKSKMAESGSSWSLLGPAPSLHGWVQALFRVWYGPGLPHQMALPLAFGPGSQSLTLQLLVPNLPLKTDGRCSLMDKALETGILTLVYRAAGWFNGDDRASEACMVRD